MAFNFRKGKKLRQESARDCSVPVFACLARVSEEEVRQDLPEAVLGLVSVSQWENWLKEKGFQVLRRDGCPADIVPCAHLVAEGPPRDRTDFHWVYRDADGNVRDPSPAYTCMPPDDPRMRDLSAYERHELTLSVSSPSQGISQSP